ncbi:hypothetical protein GCM10009854_47220 [Saccharopolyspora halophila]|uniref:Integral membrane protein n=1 Tax=Saccharopolyspora halophila TaxID=405551 RepID=A0ABP5TXV8_9PSEU
MFADAAPIFGFWYPRAGVGTPLALLVAITVITWGPSSALPWRVLLAAGYVASVAWMLSLALIDGWHAGVVARLTDWPEYLHDVPRVHDIGTTLATFTDHILAGQPDSWTVHVSGHPPGTLLFYVWLERLGLGGGTWAAVVTLLVAALVAVAVPMTARALRDEAAGRAVMPFAVLLPGAVWAGVSADGMFAGVTATGVALLAINRGRWWPALAGGALLGFGLFLSYGLTLMLPVVLAVLLRTRDWRALLFAGLSTAAVLAAFAAAGFWWLDGYHLVVQRYHQGEFANRPYAYWVFGNLGAFLLSAGPLAVAAVQRGLRNRGALGWLVLAAAASVLIADLSGLSKAEVERIWLPFAVWFAVGGALLPRGAHRWWLSLQAVTALAVNHLIATNW